MIETIALTNLIIGAGAMYLFAASLILLWLLRLNDIEPEACRTNYLIIICWAALWPVYLIANISEIDGNTHG